MKPSGFDAARMKSSQRIDLEVEVANAPKTKQEDIRLILNQLEDPLPAIQETIRLGHTHEAGKGDRMACQCEFLEHQLEHTDLSKGVPKYLQEAYDKIVTDLPEEERRYLERKYSK